MTCLCARCTDPGGQPICCADCQGVIVPYLTGAATVDVWPQVCACATTAGDNPTCPVDHPAVRLCAKCGPARTAPPTLFGEQT